MVSFTTSSYVNFDSTKSMHVLLNHLPLLFCNSTNEEGSWGQNVQFNSSVIYYLTHTHTHARTHAHTHTHRQILMDCRHLVPDTHHNSRKHSIITLHTLCVAIGLILGKIYLWHFWCWTGTTDCCASDVKHMQKSCLRTQSTSNLLGQLQGLASST